MKKIFQKIRTWFWFTFKNPIVRKGEKGAFKWTFRRLSLDIETVSGNFKARFTAAEHPYAALLLSPDDVNPHGFAAILYEVAMLLTTDQNFANAIGDVLHAYSERVGDDVQVVDDELEEKVALEEVKNIQEYVDASPKEKRRIERDSKGRFKKVEKLAE